MADVEVLPANQASWEDLEAIFGTRGDPARCRCQRYKMARGESWASVGPDELAFRLRRQTDCGHPEAETTSGLVAYLGGEPVGWCAVEPRTAYPRLLAKTRVPWDGRNEDKADDSVWALTCFVTRTAFRRRGVSHALARAAVDHARGRGARAIEGYPMTTKEALASELQPGTVVAFAAAGFIEVSRPSVRRRCHAYRLLATPSAAPALSSRHHPLRGSGGEVAVRRGEQPRVPGAVLRATAQRRSGAAPHHRYRSEAHE